jgi:hypothetical protein
LSDDLDQLVERMVAIGRRQAELEVEKQALVEQLRLTQSGPPVRPTKPPSAANGTGEKRRAAAERDQTLLDLITETPGLRAADIGRQAGMAISTTSNALRRLLDRELVTKAPDGCWSAAATVAAPPLSG